MKVCLSVLSPILWGWFIAPAAYTAEVDFARDIRPIFSDKCIFCHGPDEEHRKADLRLDLKDAAFADRDGVAAFRAGNLEGSEAWLRIVSTDPDELMPPKKSHKTLDAAEKDLVKRWIESGAEWTEHWSFVAPEKVPAPELSHETFVQKESDKFLLDTMKSKGLNPSPEADRSTLIRRVTLDLTGLPPTAEEVDQFLKDKSPDAFEKVVDRLLASKHYGERMALMWLDAARYGDTSVMHADGPRTMWPWRDWVVNAFNTNQPFDQFSIEQIAGDLLPEASVEQKIASGFNRNHASSDEGGAIAEELRVSYVVDRVKTTSNVWLGLSMECAQCHDHKYDPISQKEYFEMYAYFNNTSDPGMQTRKGNQTPVVEVVDASREDRLKIAQAKAEGAKKKLDAHKAGAEAPFQLWLTKARAEREGKPLQAEPEGLAHWFPIEESDKDSISDAASGRSGTLVEGGKLEVVDRKGAGKALKLNGKTAIQFPEFPTIEAAQPMTFTAWVNFPANPGGAIFSHLRVDDAYRGYDFWLQGGQVGTHIIHQWSGNALKVVSNEKLKPNTWQHIAVAYDGSSKAEGVKIYLDGKLATNKVEADSLSGTTVPEAKIPFKIGSRNKGANVTGQVDDLRIYHRALSAEEIAATKADPVEALLTSPTKNFTDPQRELLLNHYLSKEDKVWQKLSAEHAKLAKVATDLEKAPTTTMVMGDNPEDKKRMTYILNRGAYDQPIEDKEIKPGTPAILPPMSEDAPDNRLGLAQWLFSDDHPLPARVTVNQFWQLFFGKGIVTTAADFGAQGSFPSHPDLLDNMAVEFRESGWDVKALVKNIVMSGAYRQSSRFRPDDVEYDPENVYLARAPRFRLQAEIIRDNALSLAGILNTEMGGPGVKPYQPPGLWAEVSLGGNPKFVQDKGDKLYRRSLYTYWKRSSPPPAMQIFDAPTRESCVMQRPRTNTPLQALAAMNDVQMIEAARHFAARMIKEGGASPADRAGYGFQLATARPPAESELSALLEVYEYGKSEFSSNQENAGKLLAVGDSKRDETIDAAEQAALTMVASLILNMDETMTRE